MNRSLGVNTYSLQSSLLRIKSSKSYIIIFYSAILLVYVGYYGSRSQVDFTAFHRAATLFVSGENPYDRNYDFYFLNAPSALIFLFPFGFMQVQAASILFRIVSLFLTMVLVWKIHKLTNLNYLLILSVFVLSTPIRATFGSGLAGLFVAMSIWFLVSGIIYKREKVSPIILGVISLGVLSFKPYLILGILILYLALGKIKELFWIALVFTVCNLMISIKLPLLFYWIENMLVRSEGLTNEPGASSVVSLITRLSELIPGLNALSTIAWPVYILLNIGICFLLLTSKDLVTKVGFALVLSISAGIYLNHRDYVLLPILILILLAEKKIVKFKTTLLYLSRCGLLTSSFLFQLAATIFEPREKPKLILLAFCSLPSLVSALYWSVDLRISFLIYDFSIQCVTAILIYSLYLNYRIEKKEVRENAKNLKA